MERKKRLVLIFLLLAFVTAGCELPAGTAAQPSPTLPGETPTLIPTTVIALSPTVPPTQAPSATLPPATLTVPPSQTPAPPVPAFRYIVIILLENKEFETVMNSGQMPNFIGWAKDYTLLTQHYAVTHPSLPNYMALFSGETFYKNDLPAGPVDAPNLADLIEASGRSWKDYQESMPAPCALKDTLSYVQKHNPFTWFTSIRDNPERCNRSVVPFGQLDSDLTGQQLPNFAFIMPNLCNSAHDCTLDVTDAWLGEWVKRLLAYPGMLDDGLVILTWDEGQGDHGCCGIDPAGGRVATVLISNRVRAGFQDSTPYTHYSLLKMMSTAWNLRLLGHAADPSTTLVEAPFKAP